MKYENKPFKGELVALDGNEYIACNFDGCQLVFCGMQGVTLDGCTFNGCSWQFDGPAARTLGFMTGLYRSGGAALIEATFENIRGKQKGGGVRLN